MLLDPLIGNGSVFCPKLGFLQKNAFITIFTADGLGRKVFKFKTVLLFLIFTK